MEFVTGKSETELHRKKSNEVMEAELWGVPALLFPT